MKLPRVFLSAGLVRNVALSAGLLAAAAIGRSPRAVGQTLSNNPLVTANFSSLTLIGASIGQPTQMTFGPDGRLYVSTYGQGIRRYDYSPTGSLSNPKTIANLNEGSVNGSLGVAFHTTDLHNDGTPDVVMYAAPAIPFTFGTPPVPLNQSIVRLTDDDGDGNWGEAGEVNQRIVTGLAMTDLHEVNQMKVRGDSLYIGIGSRTRTGGEFSEYPGAPNPNDGEYAYTGAVNWIRNLSLLDGNTTTENIAWFDNVDHVNDTRPFTSTDESKMTVFSTGFRNVYGLSFDNEGRLWASMNQNENPLKPDELHQTNFQDDHKFPKINEVSGNWKTNADAIAAGFFQTFKDPIATLGNHASADGFDFTYINEEFAGQPFIVRYASGDDLRAVDPETGVSLQIVSGLNNPIDVLTDPFGNLLVAQHGNGGRIYRLNLLHDAGPFPDVNKDGKVDIFDVAAVSNNWGTTGTAGFVFADVNLDGTVDIFDVAGISNAWNPTGEAAAVPEPSAIALLALGLLGAAGVARSARQREGAA